MEAKVCCNSHASCFRLYAMYLAQNLNLGFRPLSILSAHTHISYIYQFMDTTRQQKISRLIQKELSDMFQKQTAALHGVLVSVSAVRISPDLSVCRGYLSIFPSERSAEILDNINGNVRELRYELGRRLRYQLRIIPELRFFIDDSLDYIDHIDELLHR